MKKLFFSWLLCMALPMTLTAATPLPQLRFSADEARLKQYYDKCKLAYNDPETTFLSDEVAMVKGTERERMVLRLMLFTQLLRQENDMDDGYTLFEWAQLNTKIIQNQYFRVKNKETEITIDRFDDVRKTTDRILGSIEEMAAGSQMEMNGFSNCLGMMHDYLAVLKSYLLTRLQIRNDKGQMEPMPEATRRLIEEETNAWWQLESKAVDFYDQCSTDGEWYSMKPLEFVWVRNMMCERRIQSLDLKRGYYQPDSPAVQALQTYGGKVLDEEDTPAQHLSSQSKKLMDKTGEYINNDHSEGAREAAQELREAWAAFAKIYNNSVENESPTSVNGRAFRNDLSLYVETLLSIDQGQAWE